MRGFVREHARSLTAVLTVIALALVFGAVFQVGASSLPHAPAAVVGAIPHLNALISVVAIGAILGGLRAIEGGDVDGHRRAMLAAFVLFVAFLVLYLYRVTIEGPATFDGPAPIGTFVYYPVLAVHILLAIVSLPLLFYVLLLAYAHPISALAETPHPRIGRVAAVLWLVSFALGVVVYLLLYVIFS